jgi:hypothetical protein
MTQANITDTGLRGYFKWLLQDQPALAAHVIAAVSAQVPGAFSDYDQGQALGRLRGLGDDLDSTDIFDVNDPLGLNDSTSSTGFSTGFDSVAGTGYTTATPLTTTQATSLASTANSSSVSPNVTSSISSILNSTLTSLGVPSSTASAINQMSAQQLQNAQAGLPPTNLSSAASGVPQALTNITGALGGTTDILVIGGVLLLAGLLLMGGGSKGGGGSGFTVVR